VKITLKRLDHTNIMLVIAGSYTPLAWTLLERPQAVVLLWVIWSGAILGVLFRLLWTQAPRWLYVPIYIALGCGALFYLPQFFQASPAAAVLICVGGVLYITGAVFYALKKPNISYHHFGFHELFHALTVVAFAAHFTAIALAVLS
jgi:hemolysin III